MPNYDISYVGCIGLDVAGAAHTRIVLAAVGGALLQRLLEQPDTPPGAAPALASSTHAIIASHFEPVGPTGLGTALVDWTLYGSIDLEGQYAIQIEDPAFSAADPCPTITAWAIALGGTVQGTQAHP